MSKTVFKIFNKVKGEYTGSYSRACHDEYEFDSEVSALEANCHGMYHNTDKYEIHEVEVTEKVSKKLPPKPEYAKKTKDDKAFDLKVKDVMKEFPKMNHWQAVVRVTMREHMFKNFPGFDPTKE